MGARAQHIAGFLGRATSERSFRTHGLLASLVCSAAIRMRSRQPRRHDGRAESGPVQAPFPVPPCNCPVSSRPGGASRRSSHVRNAPKATAGRQNGARRDGPLFCEGVAARRVLGLIAESRDDEGTAKDSPYPSQWRLRPYGRRGRDIRAFYRQSNHARRCCWYVVQQRVAFRSCCPVALPFTPRQRLSSFCATSSPTFLPIAVPTSAELR